MSIIKTNDLRRHLIVKWRRASCKTPKLTASHHVYNTLEHDKTARTINQNVKLTSYQS